MDTHPSVGSTDATQLKSSTRVLSDGQIERERKGVRKVTERERKREGLRDAEADEVSEWSDG